MRWRGLLSAALVMAAAMAVVAAFPDRPMAPSDRPLAPLPDGALRIVAFGTSLTARNAWPDRLQERLADCLDRPVEVRRVASVGAGSGWAEAALERVVAAAPQLVLMEFAINDADIVDGLSLTASRAKHAALLDGLDAGLPGAQVMLLTMSPVTGLSQHLKRYRLPRYYAMVRDLAEERALPLTDLAPRWRRAWARNGTLRPSDGLHPSDAATDAVVTPVLAARIGQAAGTRACALQTVRPDSG